MLSFSHYLEQAAAQHHDFDLKLKHAMKPVSAKKLAAIPDDRWLSCLSQCVFQSGFNWKVVANKWPRFDEVFCNCFSHFLNLLSSFIPYALRDNCFQSFMFLWGTPMVD